MKCAGDRQGDMKRHLIFFALLIGINIGNIVCAEVSDFVTEKPFPKRIISMTLGSDEILLSLIDPKRIIAVTHYALDPGISNVSNRAKTIPNQIRQAGVEQVTALNPDLILVASYTSADVVKQLGEIGFPVVRLETFTTFEGIKENIRTVARSVGASKNAEAVIAKMTHRLQNLQKIISNLKKRPGVLAYSPGGWTAGTETTFHEMVILAGGRNLAAEAGVKGHKKLSIEVIIKLDPEIIILSAWSPEDSDYLNQFRNDPALHHLSAVRMNRVYVLPEKYLTTVSHYIVDATEALAHLLHPKLFAPTHFKAGLSQLNPLVP